MGRRYVDLDIAAGVSAGGSGTVDANAGNSIDFLNLTFEDGATPESLGFRLESESGAISPNLISRELGDVDQDGAVDFSDIAPFIEVLTTGGFLEQADCNQDGAVDFLDITSFIAILSER